MMRKEYIDKLAVLMKNDGLDAVLVCPSEELTFLIGFSPKMCARFQGLFVKSDGTMFYLCNLIYTTEMESKISGIPIHSWFDGDVMVECVHEILKNEGLIGKKIGVNRTAQAFNILDIAEKSGITFSNAKPLLEDIRIIKTDEELENMRISASIADKAFSAVLQFVKPGMREGEVKKFLFAEMAKHGGTDHSAIVARGPNSSFPHYSSEDGIIEENDVILFDIGCAYKNMRTDMSRMVFMGEPTEEMIKIYEICRKSTEAGEAVAFENAYIPDIDKASRDVIEASGYSKFFINRLGHGIGYVGHEAPDIKASNKRRLERGMCFTIEPGINLPGKFGMRVEDVVAITSKGTEILSKTTHDMIVLK